MSRYGAGTYGTGLYGSTAALAQAEQGVYPPRVLLSATGFNLGEVLTLYRVVAGQRTPVRAAEGVVLTDTAFVVVDAELPFGVPVSYVVVSDDDYEVTIGPVTYTLPGGKVAISDAVTGLAAEVVITAWPTKRRERIASSFVVGGRNVVVSGTLAPAVADVDVFTESDSSRENLTAVLEGCLSGTVQVRQPGGYSDVDGYYAVTGASLERWSQDGTDARRKWTLSVVEVEPWASVLEARGFTYADVATAYTGLTYDDLAGDYAAYLAVAQGDYTA